MREIVTLSSGIFILFMLTLARTSLTSSIELAAGKKSWAVDVLIAAKKLPFECLPLDFSSATEKSIEAYRKYIERCATEWLQQLIRQTLTVTWKT
jgi:hypothetical protein